MKKTIKILLPLLLLGLCVWVSSMIASSRPENKKKKVVPRVPKVHVIKAEMREYPVILHSRGLMRPRMETMLVSEVSGRVVFMGNHFNTGSVFKKDEILLELDPLDAKASLAQAQQKLAQSMLDMATEQALARKAKGEWLKMDLPGQPDPLLLRIPQLELAEKNLALAKLEVQRCERDLNRTRIRAPYSGRIVQTSVDMGQHVGKGNALASIYSSGPMEIHLPLSDSDLRQLTRSQDWRGSKVVLHDPDKNGIKGEPSIWHAKLDRFASHSDNQTRQIEVIAVLDPVDGNSYTLFAGRYMEADIYAGTISDVFVIPRSCSKDDRTVQVVSPDMRLSFASITIAWKDAEFLAVTGLADQQLISTTPLTNAVAGMKVELAPTVEGRVIHP